MLRKFLLVKFLLVLGLLALAWPPLLLGQFIGYVTSQSVSQNLFTNHTGAGISATITNLGQSSHFLTVCNSSFSGTVILQSSRDGTFVPPNTVAAANYVTPGGDTNCHLIQAGGYYPTMRVQIISTTGQTSIFYSGIGGPVAPAPAALSTQGPVSPIACDQSVSTQVAANTTGLTLVQGATGQSIIVCSITISFDGNTTGGGVTGVISFGSFSSTPSTIFTCTLGTAFGNTEYVLDVTPQTPQTSHSVGGVGGLFRFTAGNPLCISIGPIGANTIVDVSFAQITF